MRKYRRWIGIIGVFGALLGFFLPFERHRSLFTILENEPIPFFSPLIVLLMALILVLQYWNLSIAQLLSMLLFLGWLFLYVNILLVYFPVFFEEMGPGPILILLGLMGMDLGFYEA